MGEFTKRGKTLIRASDLATLLGVQKATLYNWVRTFTEPFRFDKKGRSKCTVALTLVDATLIVMVQELLEHMSTFKARSLFAEAFSLISSDGEEKALEYLKRAKVIISKKITAISDGPVSFLGKVPEDLTVISFDWAMKKATPAMFEYTEQELEKLEAGEHQP